VISGSFGFHELIERIGVERRLITAGKNKAVLDPFSPTKEEDVQILRETMIEIHEHFKEHVRNQRGDRIAGQNEEELFSGRFWAGRKAVDLGLADGVLTLNGHLKREYGDRVRVMRVTANPLQQLLPFSAAGRNQLAFAAEVEEDRLLQLLRAWNAEQTRMK